MAPDAQAVRYWLVWQLRGGHAHAPFDEIVRDLAFDRQGVRPDGADHSPWELLEHLRAAQEDILEYARDPDGYRSRTWPDDYWPDDPAPPSPAAWDEACDAYRRDRDELIALIETGDRDLTEPFDGGNGHTLLRQALLVVDHDAYHLGQLVLVRKLLGAWPPADG